MKNIESEIKELIQLHNGFLENRKIELESSGVKVFRVKKRTDTVSDILGLRLRRFVFLYVVIIAIFFSTSFFIVNSLMETEIKNEFVKINGEIFKSDHKGGIVFAFNEALK
ncbi:MAG: hypothetical protein ABFR75_05130 [Acidobacteriota bacterium]